MKESDDQPRQHIKKQRHYFANKGPSSQGYGFCRGHVWMWELDCEESWALKNWCFWTVVLEETLDSPLDCKKIQPVHPKGDQSWMFIGRTDTEAETPILWPPHAKSWLTGKDPDVGRDWEQEEKGTTEDEMAGWYHWLDAHEFGWTPGVGDWQGRLACCDSWGHKELDTAEQLNWTELNLWFFFSLSSSWFFFKDYRPVTVFWMSLNLCVPDTFQWVHSGVHCWNKATEQSSPSDVSHGTGRAHGVHPTPCRWENWS